MFGFQPNTPGTTPAAFFGWRPCAQVTALVRAQKNAVGTTVMDAVD